MTHRYTHCACSRSWILLLTAFRPLLGLLGAFLVVLGISHEAHAAVKISTITPSCAAPGDTVVITGNGFGAKNVTVKVGSVVAKVVSATGAKVTFLIPSSVSPGLVTVTATNPGEQSGSIEARIKGPELCGNTIDDNCNGTTDEGFDVGSSCSAGVGVCARTGAKVCSPDGKATVCNATPGAPTAELCNNLDDNCNGTVDDGFTLGTTCSVGTGVCIRSGVTICAADGSATVCNATPGTPTAEICNNLDDNCNGQVDEGVGQTRTCGVGACARTVTSCANGQPQECVPGNPTAEICANGIDEDCNGSDLACTVTLAIAITGPVNLSSTNQSTIAVTGTVDPQATEVTCNGRPTGINTNGFGGNVPLKEGSNVVTCVAKDAAGNLGSASITVSLDSTPPRVTIDSPQEGATITASPITVTGIVNDLVMGTVNGDEAGVKCNGIQAQVANRRFVATNIPLNGGSNIVTCIGEDKVGNVDTARVTVTLNTAVQAKIAIVSGNNQTAGIGALLPEPLVVALTENGAPAAGKAVVFKVLQNDGVLSTSTGTNTNSGRILAVATDTNGRASVLFTLGSWAGAGNNQVEALANGFVGEARFHESALPASPNNIVVDAGNLQFGVVGQPLPKPFIATVIDRGSNRLGSVPVTFTVKDGGGNFAGQTTQTINTDSDGRAQAVLTLGPDEGFDNNVVEATFPNNPGAVASFTASGKTAGNPQDTKISGVVLDNSNNPVQGVKLHVEGTTTTTLSNAQGQFVIQPAPVGKVLLIADGSTVPLRNGLPWPKLEYELVTIAGQNNTVGMPIYLLPIDTPRGLLVDETHGGTLTLAELPGFALNVVPGSATFPDGSKRGTVSVTLVHADKVPMVPNFGQQPRFIITIQPAGTHFNPPAALTMPNVDGLSPGQKTEMYSFDHDLGSFVSIGPATVSEDGTVIKSDPGVGVVKGGWHCGGNPSQTGSCCQCNPCEECVNNQCVPITLANSRAISDKSRTSARAQDVPNQCPVCRNASDCNDSKECTIDSCSISGCKHEQVKIDNVELIAENDRSKKDLIIPIGRTVNFTVEVQSTCQGNISYTWNFGDGTTEETTQNSTSHLYKNSVPNGTAEVKVTARCGDCTNKESNILKITPVEIQIEEVWSEQFGFVGKTTNALPDRAGRQSVRGNYILMGAQRDGNFHAGAQLKITPDTGEVRQKLLARLAYVTAGSPPTSAGEGTIQQNLAMMSASPPISFGVFLARVAVGIDENVNGQLDQEEVGVLSDKTFRMVTQQTYQDAVRIAQSGDIDVGFSITEAFTPIARLLLDTFLMHRSPSVPFTSETITATVGGDCESGSCLDHNVGVLFNNTGGGPILVYHFPADSDLANAIRRSGPMRDILTLSPGTCRVEATERICEMSTPRKITFLDPRDSGEISFSALDLFLGIGDAFLNISITTRFPLDNPEKEAVSIRGTLSDLYDFNQDAPGAPNRLGANIQAGFGTLGTAGSVFRHTVDLSIDIPDLNAFLLGQ